MIVEEGMGWNSRHYINWKPYKPADRNYNWTDYVTRDQDGKVISCHSCDIRKTGCQSPSHPRYFCKRDKKTIQTSLMEW